MMKTASIATDSDKSAQDETIFIGITEWSQLFHWGLDPTLAHTDPQAIRFLFDTWLGETVAMFKNASQSLANNDIDIQNRNGKAFIKKENNQIKFLFFYQ